MARRKIVLIIVEGPSDDTALGVSFSEIYDKDYVYIHILHGDITTRRTVTPQNIIAKIGNDVREYAKAHHYKASDFKQIIHIIDTDGAYIPSDKVMLDCDAVNPVYQSDGIYTRDVDGIILRNEVKQGNLYRLRSCSSVWSIPYKVYYMSSNLDHVLYNKRNSTEEEKDMDAHAFARRYKNKQNEFITFICDSTFSVKGDFHSTWHHIEQGMNSLERYTNLGVCLHDAVAQNSTKR